ncbi:hypothetical protein A3A93_03570 [Candidatus Roizmanbacteria bacterium RIFCSPLOWO2_01_FULL_38_12]|uniref:Uncharacterized protein n=1 Tax=Candidatus Roizmanbacteria bacterium RIFCSPLOWO2_01_FULL_38_12 TaxID=1802061 RepID=A0A1F7IYW0_9BACT|nr:MAG: hypothetical protein A3F59_02155 [Candidatus Roizmanbacteria bacterium RIFCSPHIGHO2_12_FULL_38_13]OGK48515.1 MAG: hypothetical protein A3A93_03570 [Candidatus Roizmanbacteria bacterium RIFCSPLOWO2_01_FULL_38_12]
MLALQEARTRFSTYAHEHVLLMESLAATGVLAFALLAGKFWISTHDYPPRPETTCMAQADTAQQQDFLNSLDFMKTKGWTPQEQTAAIKQSCSTIQEAHNHYSRPLGQR